ncbi:MAG: hypothetical protein R6U43_06715 [Candidatus Krumholzibacteriales bacterium]
MEPETEETVQEVQKQLEEGRYAEIVFCGYGEPTTRLDFLLDTADALKKQNLPLRLNTNGQGNMINRRNLKNGNGTAVVMVIIGLALWVSAGWLHQSKWFLFLNPFSPPTDMSEAVWSDIVFKNRIYLVTGAVISILAGLFNLQKREKFV